MAAGRERALEDDAREAIAILTGPRLRFAQVDELFEGGRSDANRAYSLSSAFFGDLLARHGPAFPRRVLRRMADGEPFEEAFRSATGVEFRDESIELLAVAAERRDGGSRSSRRPRSSGSGSSSSPAGRSASPKGRRAAAPRGVGGRGAGGARARTARGRPCGGPRRPRCGGERGPEEGRGPASRSTDGSSDVSVRSPLSTASAGLSFPCARRLARVEGHEIRTCGTKPFGAGPQLQVTWTPRARSFAPAGATFRMSFRSGKTPRPAMPIEAIFGPAPGWRATKSRRTSKRSRKSATGSVAGPRVTAASSPVEDEPRPVRERPRGRWPPRAARGSVAGLAGLPAPRERGRARRGRRRRRRSPRR